MALTIIVTDAGRAALVNAANTGTAPVTIAEVGLSATAVVPSAAATALPGEFKRLATLSGDVVADDTIHLIVRDEGSDVFTVRSMALYLADGTLFAIYGQADVLVEKSAQAMMLIAIDVQFPDIDAATLTFGDANFLNAPATTTTQGVVKLATIALAQAGLDALTALTPATAKAAILGWLLTQDGAGSGIDADLLDGQQGSYYADIPARLGFAPVNKAGDTMTGLLTLSGDPTAAGHATRKSYVDALVTAAAILAKLVTVDGAGSGIDADLLDGQQGSYYADIPARLGFTPVNKAGDTMTGLLTLSGDPTAAGHATRKSYVDALVTAAAILAKLVTVDGAGSGLDADLLDGQQGSYYTAITARLGYTPVDVADYTAADVKTKLLTVDGAGSGFDADLLDGQQGSYYTNIIARLGYTPLDAADYTAADLKAKLLTVDGSGSGIDADTVDGIQGASLVTLTGAQTLANKTLTSPSMTAPIINSAPVATVVGTAPLFMARAWVNFNGAGTVSINGGGNVSSITDNGIGRYTVNFTTAIADDNYAVAIAIGNGSQTVDNESNNYKVFAGAFLTSSFSFSMYADDDVTKDFSSISVTIHR